MYARTPCFGENTFSAGKNVYLMKKAKSYTYVLTYTRSHIHTNIYIDIQ